MALPIEEQAIVTGCLHYGNLIMNCIVNNNTAVSVGDLLKLQPEIKRFAAECVQHWYYISKVGAKVDEVKPEIEESKDPVQAAVNIVLDFVKRFAGTAHYLDLVPVALYYFPLLDYCLQVNIDQLAAMDFEIPKP